MSMLEQTLSISMIALRIKHRSAKDEKLNV
jgi:hypothetical protein